LGRRPVGGCCDRRAFVRARGGAVGAIGLLAAAVVAAFLSVRRGGAVGAVGMVVACTGAARLSLRGRVRLGRSVS